MEQKEDIQLVIHLKKGIFQQMIRKKKLKQILSNRRRKEDQTSQTEQSIIEIDLLLALKNKDFFKNKHQDFKFLYNLIALVKQQINMQNKQIVLELFDKCYLLDFLVETLKSFINEEMSTQFINEQLDYDQIVLDILFIFINLTYYIDKNDLMYTQIVLNFCSNNQCYMENDSEQSDLKLIEKIAQNYSNNEQILEYLIQFLNNLIYLENQAIIMCVIESQVILELVIELIQNNQDNKDIIDEVTHLVYNLTRQKQYYSFEQINDVLYLIYILIPLVKQNTQGMNRTIQSLSYALDNASQQEFIDFAIQNYNIFETLSEIIDNKSNNLEENSTKEGETIQIILEIFLLASDILDLQEDQIIECFHLKQIIWVSCEKPFNQASILNAEIIVLCLKIMNQILQNSSQILYFINSILNASDLNSKSLRNIIYQCCEWNNTEIANEFISLLCNLFKCSQSIEQILHLLNFGIIIILVESLKTDMLFYETKEEIFQIIIDLFNLEEKYFDQESICSQIRFNAKMQIQQIQGIQILEGILNSKVTEQTSYLIEKILNQTNQAEEFD
ncbi:hypothetical protein ABPG72_013080 [Tetrahymena utriculariae]